MVNLKIASLNVRGIANFKKRRKLFHYLHKKEFDIVCLQETHSLKVDYKRWKSEWGGRMFCSHGTSNSRGVAILISKKVPLKVKYSHNDQQGRYVILETEFESLSFIISTVYAPNEDSPQFFQEWFETLASLPTENKILVGDWNFVLDPSIDKLGGSKQSNNKALRTVKEYMNTDKLIDVWRKLHPDVKQYTWHRSKPELVMTRLDMFMIPEILLPLVVSAEILPSFMSDHSIIRLIIELDNKGRGPGFWKLNTSLLDIPEYLENVSDIITENSKATFTDTRAKWNFLKQQIKEYSIKFATARKRSENNQLEVLERKMLRLKTNIEQSSFTGIFNLEEDIEELDKIKTEIDILVEKKTQGAMVRARTDWFQYGEKSSKYFFKLEQSNFSKKNRFCLRTEEGSIITDQKQILHEQEIFYENLYQAQDINVLPDINYLKGLDLPCISTLQREEMDSDITSKEVYDVILEMKKNKTPGTDGLPVEFYLTFWNQIQDLFINMLKEIVDLGMTINQGRGIISLIEKPDRDLLLLKNWRPLSLLNVDYKIYSKILANRLYEILPYIIHQDQVGFLKNRFIGENLLDLTAVIEYLKENDEEGILVSADIEKAFDSVHWETMYSFFEAFGISSRFCNMVRMLYLNTSSCTINNGYCSKWFKISRSLRQGCCFSPPGFFGFYRNFRG